MNTKKKIEDCLPLKDGGKKVLIVITFSTLLILAGMWTGVEIARLMDVHPFIMTSGLELLATFIAYRSSRVVFGQEPQKWIPLYIARNVHSNHVITYYMEDGKVVYEIIPARTYHQLNRQGRLERRWFAIETFLGGWGCKHAGLFQKGHMVSGITIKLLDADTIKVDDCFGEPITVYIESFLRTISKVYSSQSPDSYSSCWRMNLAMIDKTLCKLFNDREQIIRQLCSLEQNMRDSDEFDESEQGRTKLLNQLSTLIAMYSNVRYQPSSTSPSQTEAALVETSTESTQDEDNSDHGED